MTLHQRRKLDFLRRSAPRKDVADDSQLTSAFPRITYPHSRPARLPLSYPSPLWGGWLAEGQSGGVARTYMKHPHPSHRSRRSRCATLPTKKWGEGWRPPMRLSVRNDGARLIQTSPQTPRHSRASHIRTLAKLALPFPSHFMGRVAGRRPVGWGCSHIHEAAPTRHIVRAAHDAPPSPQKNGGRDEDRRCGCLCAMTARG
jgi:hypothetical protein